MQSMGASLIGCCRAAQRRGANVDRKSQAERILARLEQGPATTLELIQLGICCPTRRIFELRKANYEIEMTEQWRGKTRTCTYTLKGQMSLPMENVA
jgi:hypothetical protein